VDKDNYRVEYCTVSEQLATDVQHLLLRFGIVAKKRRREVKYKDGTRTAWDVSFQDTENVEKFIGHIGMYSKMERLADVLQVALNRKENAPAHDLLPMEVWDMVLEDKGDLGWADVSEATGRPRNHNWHVHRRRLSRRLLRELGKALSSDRLLTLADSDIVWDPIVSIEPAGLRPTYDLSIDGSHNFVADDIIVHNSSLALGIAVNAALQQEPVAIFSLEMSKEEIVQRILSSVGRVDSMKLRSGQLGPLWQRVVDAAGKMYQAPIYIDDSPVVTVTDIRAKSRRLKRKKGLSLVVIDYLQLMESSSRENRQQEISEITRNLKNLARELEVPVIAVSQLNRSLETREDKRPRLSDLRESGCLTADTRLVRADTNEEVTLGELVASGATNVPVWSLNDRYQLVASRLTKAFPSGVKAVFDLELASGRVVRASGNHPFLTIDGWSRLDQLVCGDQIAAARHGSDGVADSPSDLIPESIWTYIEEKAMPVAGLTSENLARILELPLSALYRSGISRARMRRLADALDDDYLDSLAESDVLWDRVVSITPLGEQEVFDATVDLTHNFLANGIVAHNSIEQDADVVMFIYRHEYYHPEDQERKGIAEVIVAKHRAGSTGPVEVTFQPEFTRFANLGRDVT
jgi:replicative DNA helicase